LADAKSIIIFFIPFEDRIVESNLEGEAASEDWARAYVLTNELLSFINEKIEVLLNENGFQAVKTKATHNYDEKTLMSRWSHRHIAWAAGLGTFGINNMLITSRGCCGRIGSLVTNADCLELGISASESVPLPEKCLNKINGSCKLCHKKCPVGAYNEEGDFDRHKCHEACLKNAELYQAIGSSTSCGKCLVGLPCSTSEPRNPN
jgi:epoxyqueuosine reductase QueG